jgi:putative two-component system response regulator
MKSIELLPAALCMARVVVIDDVLTNLRLLQSSLSAFGLRQLKVFSDPAVGLEWLQHNDWDLLLLDLDMPAPDGFEILRQLAGRDRGSAPVIIVTALSDLPSRRRGLQLGANDYLCKPLDLPELLLRVRNNLELSQARQALQQERESLEQKVQQRTEQLSGSYRALILSLSRAAEYKDNETGNHILRIGESAALMARALDQDADWVEMLRLAAPMHDIGKIGIPDHILGKPGAFTAEERALMNHHPRIGYDILHAEPTAPTEPLMALAAEIALYHHEKWDGSGYPHGLKGLDIPLSARIVALCDVYDALRSLRPYKQPWTAERAQAHIHAQAGEHFDPQLVAVMSGLFGQLEQLQESMADTADTL